ncbi:thiamine pyrophosphokinase-related protein [Xylaria intraflava]|nr:thiamine pyrophosphokinase-related protein [Xylaria intraflava]
MVEYLSRSRCPRGNETTSEAPYNTAPEPAWNVPPARALGVRPIFWFLVRFRSTMPQTKQFSCLLDIVNYCDDFPLPEQGLEAYDKKVNSYYHFMVASVPGTLGFVLPEVARKFRKCPGWEVDDVSIPGTLTLSGGHDDNSRSEIVKKTVEQFRKNKTFQILKKWRQEVKPAYGPTGELLFSINRAAFPLLGIVAYGVQMVAFTRNSRGGVKGLWVQKRSQAATNYPGFLDNTVAGGMATGEKPFDALIHEAEEEASFTSELVRRRAKACGTVSYFHTRKADMGGEVGLLQPGVQFLYEMELPRGVQPRSQDKAVEGFRMIKPGAIRDEMLAGRLKPWFALVVIDFFVRHGIIDEANERDFVEISVRLHRKLEFPVFGVSFHN